MGPDRPIPLYQKLFALGLVILYAALVYVFRSRIGADFWPFDSSRVGPNLVASFVLAGPAAVLSILLYPPIRRRLHRFVDAKLEPIHQHSKKTHEHSAEVRAHHAWQAEVTARIAAKAGVNVPDHPHFDISTNTRTGVRSR